MLPVAFAYLAPRSVEEASLALEDDAEAVLLAGGQSLIPMLRLRLARPSCVIDLGAVLGLTSIGARDGALAFGPLTTVSTIRGSAEVHSTSRLLHEASGVIADPLVRAMGTIAGNLAHADPRNDLPAVLVASKGVVTAQSAGGRRSIPARELFLGPFMTSLAPGEIITEVAVPTSSFGAYEKFKRSAGDYGVAGVAVQLLVEGDRVSEAGIALTGMSEVAQRAASAEEVLVGSRGEEAEIEYAAELVAGEASPTADERGSERYKRALVRTLSRRAIARAFEQRRRQAP
jgi:CO/xanthine dehydrogenase FAD-binding subunit